MRKEQNTVRKKSRSNCTCAGAFGCNSPGTCVYTAGVCVADNRDGRSVFFEVGIKIYLHLGKF